LTLFALLYEIWCDYFHIPALPCLCHLLRVQPCTDQQNMVSHFLDYLCAHLRGCFLDLGLFWVWQVDADSPVVEVPHLDVLGQPIFLLNLQLLLRLTLRLQPLSVDVLEEGPHLVQLDQLVVWLRLRKFLPVISIPSLRLILSLPLFLPRSAARPLYLFFLLFLFFRMPFR